MRGPCAPKLNASVRRLRDVAQTLFAVSVIAIGILTVAVPLFHGRYPTVSEVVPVIPWPPSARLGDLCGALWTLCGIGLLTSPTRRPAAIALGALLFCSAMLWDAPRYALHVRDMNLRTRLFEPLAIAGLAWLLPDRTIGVTAAAIARYAVALSLVVFGIDHFLALTAIATIVPSWLPWHVFWAAVFGALMIVCGIGIAFDVKSHAAAAALAAMFGVWVITLHIPSCLPSWGEPGNPNRWSSLFIAMLLCAGFAALALRRAVATSTGSAD